MAGNGPQVQPVPRGPIAGFSHVNQHSPILGHAVSIITCHSLGGRGHFVPHFGVADPSPLSSLCRLSPGDFLSLQVFLAQIFLKAGVGHGWSQSGTSIFGTSRNWHRSGKSAGHHRKKSSVDLRITRWKCDPHLYVKPCFFTCSNKGLSVSLSLRVALKVLA